jgi:hypothetical protein
MDNRKESIAYSSGETNFTFSIKIGNLTKLSHDYERSFVEKKFVLFPTKAN